MKKLMQVPDNQQVELSYEKQPYEAPRLKKLGTIKGLTQGGTTIQSWDDAAFHYS